jgi:hypothetical protein
MSGFIALLILALVITGFALVRQRGRRRRERWRLLRDLSPVERAMVSRSSTEPLISRWLRPQRAREAD